jgi:nitrite reductase (NO-forming)
MESFFIELIFPLANTLATLAIACQVVSLLLGCFLLYEWKRRALMPNRYIHFIAKNCLLLMLLVAFTASMGSLYFSEIAGWAPCKLCWMQRIFMYPQVLLLGIALWRRELKILPYILVLSLLGMSISIFHYSEQVMAMLDPLGHDASAPCDFSGVSCAAAYIQAYGYITVPMLALTAFLSIALIGITALRHPQFDAQEEGGMRKFCRTAAGVAVVLFLLFFSFAATHTQGGSATVETSEGPVLQEILPLTPKSQLETIIAKEGIHWTHVPAVPQPIKRTGQRKIIVEWTATERIGDLDSETGVQYEFWGFEGSAPGPTLRVRQGDLVEFRLTNDIESEHPHNIDFHFSTGPGGGAKALSVNPGETAVVHLRALQPGFYMYHCATPDIPTHIANGMYGGVIVDPADAPLPNADNEFVIVQSEFYTESDEPGIQQISPDRLDAEDPTYVVFNGAVGSLTGENSPYVNVGESVRLFVLNAGPQLISSFHVIGEIFDRVYREGDFFSPPGRGIQSTLIPAGGASVVDFTIDVPGTYILVDHAIARAIHKGAVGTIVAEGSENHEVFQSFADADAPDGHMKGQNDHIPEQPESVIDAPFSEGEDGVTVRILKNSMKRDGDPDNDYEPKVLTIKAGTTVHWVNDDRVVHTVTARDRSFHSGNMRKGKKWSHTFIKPGEYEYYCIPHPWMVGKVIVEE